MRLLRVGPKGSEKPALLDKEGALRDLSGVIADITGAVLTAEGLNKLAALDAAKLPKIEDWPRIGAPIGRIGKVVGVGVNYKDYIAVTGQPAPEEPIMFLKPDCSIAGPNDDVKKPKTSQKLDWECELAIVIGKEGTNIAESDAMNHIAGWMLANDYTERWFQQDRGGTWDKGKVGDNFTPLGPWLATRDEIADADGLKMWLTVNGKRFQDSNTANMIRRPAFLVSYLSEFLTFYPGDVIVTGSPAGVGALQKPPVFLNAGDVVELGIEGLGEQKQKIV
ncbi:MAG TPA: fumarylacetoacetate hydrolase family protein [Rhizomicrobium sp.]|jgi:2,4-diketo-3-deoxy-L-fuconate hydrolase|nr:fumarylacetoacetate hydrolase family protein [Rhizomicrobium sp.]